MVALTLSDPDVIFIEPSQAKDNNTERAYSYVYAKTFKRNGEKIKYFTSVTVAKEGLEISVSSHFVNPNKMKNKLMEFERAYTKETLLPNSSEMRLTEHQSDVPDLLPTQDTASASKDTQSSNNEQGSSVKNQETDAIPTDEEVGITQSNSVLQGEEVDNSRGDNESQEQGGAIEVGTQGEVENGLVHQGAQGGVDKQGNPINADGTLKVDKVNSINELTDTDFENPTRNVELPAIPENVDKAISANGKPVVIKKNIFEKNKKSHNFSNQQSRDILTNALYNTDLVGQTQPTKRPKHWVAIQLDEKSPITVLEVNENKDNVEVVGWYTLDNRNLERIKRQAANEGGELLMLSSKDKVESLSTPNSILSSADKGKQSSATKQANKRKSTESNAVSEDLFATAERVAVEDEAKRTRKKEEAKVDKRLVSDERMEELKKRLREKLRGQLNMGIDPELLAIGTEIAVGHIERGVSKFSEYAKTMIEDLGDTIRPYLKAFYNGARDMPELGELADQLTPYEEVRTFNVATIGEEGEEVKPTILQQAEQISNEHQVEQKTKEEAKQTSETTDVDNELYSITKQHNNKKDVDIWVVRGKGRVERDVFLQQKQTARQTNGYYSSFRGVNGFVFNTSEEAQMFADKVFNTENKGNYAQKSEEIMRTDNQGNPIDKDGKLIIEKVGSISDLADEDFEHPTRSVELPTIPQNIDEAIGANGKPVVIKKNIFEKNKQSHSDLTPVQSRDILQSALYNADLYGQNQKAKRPYNWIVINTKDKTGNNRLVLLEVNDKKDNVEIVHWHYIREAALETIKRQAEREGGLILILPSDYSEEAGGLSSRTQDLSSVGKDTQSSHTKQEIKEENAITEREGLKIGDKVMYKGKEATIYAIEEDRPLLDTGLAPVMYELGRWEDVIPIKEKPLEAKDKDFKEVDNKNGDTKLSDHIAEKEQESVGVNKKVVSSHAEGSLFDEAPSLTNKDKDDEVHVRNGGSTAKREQGHEPQQNESLGESKQNEAERPDGRRMGGRDTTYSPTDAERSGRVSDLSKSKRSLKCLFSESLVVGVVLEKLSL